MQRQDAARKLLQQTPCEPINLQELQSLHRLWHLVNETQKAGELVSRYRDVILQKLAQTSGTEKIQTQLHLDFMQIQSDLYINKISGLRKLRECAELIKTLPAQLNGVYTQAYNQYSERYFFYCERSWQQYWLEWLDWVKKYRAWGLAQYGIEQRQKQNERLNKHKGDLHWSRALAYIEKAYIARWRSIYPEYPLTDKNYDNVEQHVYQNIDNAIAELNLIKAKSNNKTDYFSCWLHLAWRLMDEPISGDPLLPQYVPKVMQAAQSYIDKHSKVIPACPIIQRYNEVRENQAIATSYWFTDEVSKALEIAKTCYFNTEDEIINDRFGSIYLSLLENSQQLNALAPIALEALFNVRSESASSAYIIAQRVLHLSPRRYKQSAQTQAIWQVIMAWAAIHPEIKALIKENSLAPPVASCQESLSQALQYVPNYPLVDLIQGWHLANKMRWAEALPLLERGIAHSPNHLITDDFIIKLCCARFATLEAEHALQRPWYLAGGAVLNMYCGKQLLNSDYLLERQGIGSYWNRRYHAFLTPENARISLAQHYFSAALKRADDFIQTPLNKTDHFSFSDSLTPKNYAELCQQLVGIYREQEQFDKARFLEQKASVIHSFLAK